jgi:hypothetical protein
MGRTKFTGREVSRGVGWEFRERLTRNSGTPGVVPKFVTRKSQSA